jgi:hypothetical protein
VRLVAHFNLLHVWLDGAHFCGSATSFMQTSGRGCVSCLCFAIRASNQSTLHGMLSMLSRLFIFAAAVKRARYVSAKCSPCTSACIDLDRALLLVSYPDLQRSARYAVSEPHQRLLNASIYMARIRRLLLLPPALPLRISTAAGTT